MDTKLFYVVPRVVVEFPFEGMSLQERRDRLGALVASRGAEWASLRMRGPDFLAAVEEIDRFLGANKAFVDSAFESSPLAMLPIGSTGEYDPLFGYYEPRLVQRFNDELGTLPLSVLSRLERGENGDLMGQVLSAFRATFGEAARRKHAVVIEHR